MSAEIRKRILDAIDSHVSNEDKRDFADLCCDILNASGKSRRELAGITDLSENTIARIMGNCKPYNPNTRTVEKVFKAFSFRARVY